MREMVDCPYKFGIPTVNVFFLGGGGKTSALSCFGDLRYKLKSKRAVRNVT
jgi:hypothetical protein